MVRPHHERWARHLVVFAMPLCAVIVYALFLATGHTCPTNRWVYFLVMPLGFAAYLVSLWTAYRPRSRPSSAGAE